MGPIKRFWNFVKEDEGMWTGGDIRIGDIILIIDSYTSYPT